MPVIIVSGGGFDAMVRLWRLSDGTLVGESLRAHVLRPLMAPDRPNAPPELLAALGTLDLLGAD
jgi:hypothetical protein